MDAPGKHHGDHSYLILMKECLGRWFLAMNSSAGWRHTRRVAWRVVTVFILHAKRSSFTVDLGFGVVVVRNVPALVCDQCGADWIADETAERLEKTVNAQ